MREIMSGNKIGKRIVGVLSILIAAASAALADDLPAQTIKPAGTTVLFAQTMDWFDPTHFVVGRWDGTLSLFRTPKAGEWGPMVTQAMALPSGQGVEMVAAVDGSTIVSSDGRESLAVWRRDGAADAEQDFELVANLPYDPTYGPANSGLITEVDGAKLLVTGHESGAVIYWQQGPDGGFSILRHINVASPNAPSNPWQLHNVRGLALWNDTTVVTGSEDGDLVGLSVRDGSELFRVRYNEKAQRGINNISVLGNWLLVVNCAVGSADKNLWLFDLSSGTPVLSDAENLALDLSRSQVFNFDADLVAGADGPMFFSSTEEGLLWVGGIEGGQLIVTGITKSSPEGGSVVDVAPGGDLVAVATYALRLFEVR
ncbi:hypothetical protein ASC89_15960 [Devosia sp. Root413D1]|nr:hypothetical protein ASC89_15960 [Devosia sp. Root413D1]